jgi:hypothetical protein
MKRYLGMFLLVTCAVSAGGQIGIYAMGSAGNISSFSTPLSLPPVNGINGQNGWTYGGTFGVYDNFLSLGPLKLGADARGIAQGTSRSTTTTTYGNQIRGGMTGLRLALHAPLLKPYIQAELGGVSTNYTALGQSSTRSLSGVYQVQIGVDYTLIPHLDIRGEYGVGQLFDYPDVTNNSNKPRLQQAGIGAVLRF